MTKNKGKSQRKHSGSNPSLSAKKVVNRVFQSTQVRQNMAHLVSGGYAPGGAKTETQMRAQLVKLHTTGKRWYVTYYITLPTGQRERKKAYGYVNAEKDLEKRMQLLIELQNNVFYSLQNKSVPSNPIVGDITIFKCTNDVLAEKKQWLKKNAYLAVQKHLKRWKEYLLYAGISTKHPSEITQTDVINYRIFLLQKGLSNRTVNNYIEDLRTLFNYLVKSRENILSKNPLINIQKLPARSEVHVSYTDSEAVQISEYLKENDTWMLFFIKFVAYCFLRVDETRLLQIKHFDFEQWRVLLPAANNKVNNRKWKIIPDIFRDEFINRNLQQYPKEYYLFSLKGKPGKTPVNNKYFTNRYRPVKKYFGLSDLHTLYGFRHTFISQLIRSGIPWDEIMKVTGHTTMSSFEKYIRSIMALPAKDLSKGFTVKL